MKKFQTELGRVMNELKTNVKQKMSPCKSGEYNFQSESLLQRERIIMLTVVARNTFNATKVQKRINKKPFSLSQPLCYTHTICMTEKNINSSLPGPRSTVDHVDLHESMDVHGVPILGELSVEIAATPPNSALLSNFCSAPWVISWATDEIWPI